MNPTKRKYRRPRQDYHAVRTARQHWIEEGRRLERNRMREAINILRRVATSQIEVVAELKDIVQLTKGL
jgi:hypothetical protein